MTSFVQCKTLEMLDDSCSNIFEVDDDESMKEQRTTKIPREETIMNNFREQEIVMNKLREEEKEKEEKSRNEEYKISIKEEILIDRVVKEIMMKEEEKLKERLREKLRFVKINHITKEELKRRNEASRKEFEKYKKRNELELAIRKENIIKRDHELYEKSKLYKKIILYVKSKISEDDKSPEVLERLRRINESLEKLDALEKKYEAYILNPGL